MALFALADLHLSHTGDKPMDVFGELWRNHAARMQEAWDRSVGEDDTVLLAGDLSWGRSIEEAQGDLRWIGERTGRKVLLKGNHDTWWSGVGRVRKVLPAGCEALHNDAHEVGDWVVVGARGWLAPDDPIAEPSDARIFHRELERLRLSIADADRRFDPGRPRIAMVHYPPLLQGRAPTDVVGVLAEAGVSICVYGHLHGEDHAMAVHGAHHGIRFVFVAADAVDFTPVPIRRSDAT